jgi:prepilin-type N-terminal cleavage/methylation domain-containing protein
MSLIKATKPGADALRPPSHKPAFARHFLGFGRFAGGEYSRKGFTLIEIVVAMAVLAVVAAFVGTVGYDFYRSQAFTAERDNLLSLLRSARVRALNNINQADHGVYIGANSYVIFEGSSYAARNAAFDEAYPRLPGVTASGTSEVVFHSPDGISNVSGTISLISGTAKVDIGLNYEGRIDW